MVEEEILKVNRKQRIEILPITNDQPSTRCVVKTGNKLLAYSEKEKMHPEPKGSEHMLYACMDGYLSKRSEATYR